MIELYFDHICINYSQENNVISMDFPNVNSLIDYLEKNQELEEKILETDYSNFNIYDPKHALEFFRWYFNDEDIAQCSFCNNYTESVKTRFASITEYFCSNCGHIHYDI